MTEIPRRNLESHPLWPLYKFITAEQLENFGRLMASDFRDIREANFQIFLQEEAKDRLSMQLARDIIPSYKDNDTSRQIIADPKIRKEYEEGWKKLFKKAKDKSLNRTEVLKEIDSLFSVWSKATKTVIPFSLN
ncbi:MAG TPA: hypothetical protein VKC54_04785 [Patescibacteria group bacterium]|nr:hypothetical protein [Patescibacteria group bacterium]